MKRDAKQEGEFVSQITRHQAVLRNYIVSMMPGMDGVDDVLQETNILLWEKRASCEMGTNFRAWASSIARFKVMEQRLLGGSPRAFALDEDRQLLDVADEKKGTG